MSKFLKLRSALICIDSISHVRVYDRACFVHLKDSREITGWLVFMSGGFTSYAGKPLEFTKERHPEDYKKIVDWFDAFDAKSRGGEV